MLWTVYVKAQPSAVESRVSRRFGRIDSMCALFHRNEHWNIAFNVRLVGLGGSSSECQNSVMFSAACSDSTYARTTSPDLLFSPVTDDSVN